MDTPIFATDGVVTLRAPVADDVIALLTARDDAAERFLGPADEAPTPTACIVVGSDVVGWIDFDTDRAWLLPGEVNVGYLVAPEHRGKGYATRAVPLLLAHLAAETEHHTATLLIHPDNERSLALAERLGFPSAGDLDGNPYFKLRFSP